MRLVILCISLCEAGTMHFNGGVLILGVVLYIFKVYTWDVIVRVAILGIFIFCVHVNRTIHRVLGLDSGTSTYRQVQSCFHLHTCY